MASDARVEHGATDLRADDPAVTQSRRPETTLPELHPQQLTQLNPGQAFAPAHCGPRCRGRGSTRGAKAGRIPSVRIGGQAGTLRFIPEDIEEWLAEARGGMAARSSERAHATPGK
jgi:hypothetical protein